MNNRRIPLLGVAFTVGAILTLGACSSDSSDTTIVTADSVAAGPVTSAAMTTDAMTTDAMTTDAMTTDATTTGP